MASEAQEQIAPMLNPCTGCSLQEGGEAERLKLTEEIKASNEATRKAEEEREAAEEQRCGAMNDFLAL